MIIVCIAICIFFFSCLLVSFFLHFVCSFFFFFKQKTAYEMRISDWSSDVCSSDLHRCRGLRLGGDQFSAVHAQEDVSREKGGALVSVYEGWLRAMPQAQAAAKTQTSVSPYA